MWLKENKQIVCSWNDDFFECLAYREENVQEYLNSMSQKWILGHMKSLCFMFYVSKNTKKKRFPSGKNHLRALQALWHRESIL